MTEKLFRDVEYNYQRINEQIAEAAEKSGRRREDITFLAATKTVAPEVINHAISLGLDHIGENRVQELLSKYDAYDLSHKSGVFEENLEELLCQIAQLEGISVKGLMTIPPVCENKHKNLKYFYNMHKLFIDISEKKLDNVSMTILSMGMSSDFYEAILEGANMVRIGSALFGARNYT